MEPARPEMSPRGEVNLGELVRSRYARDAALVGFRHTTVPSARRLPPPLRDVRLEQFDAVLHVDETRAVEPLERKAEWEAGEVPETFAFSV